MNEQTKAALEERENLHGYVILEVSRRTKKHKIAVFRVTSRLLNIILLLSGNAEKYRFFSRKHSATSVHENSIAQPLAAAEPTQDEMELTCPINHSSRKAIISDLFLLLLEFFEKIYDNS